MSGASGAGRPTRAGIDLDAFRANLALARRLAGGGAQVLAVVKADAYGHGAPEIARAAAGAGAALLGVATAGEARELREAGVALPVLILSEVPPEEAGEVVSLGCAQVVYTAALAEALERAGAAAGRRVPVHLKVDTGMGRVGIPAGEAGAFSASLRARPHLALEGLMSHLAEADAREPGPTERQLARFAQACAAAEAVAGPVRYRHVANSAQLMRGGAAGNLARPGIMLYGSPPAGWLPHAGELRPVMRLATRVAFLKEVPAGTPLSYGATFVTGRASRIATLPVGYADGYRRALSNRAAVLVRGRRAAVVGTVCMDMCLADVTDIPEVRVGDEAVLIGRQGREEIAAGEVAAWAGTISYEILCGIGRRVPRVHSRDAVGYDARGRTEEGGP